MIRLFVAEKPSVARDLAAVLGARRKHDGYLEGDGVRVTWCIGHLVGIAPPEEHDARWKRWDPALLPMLPRTLLLQPQKKTASHLRALCRLLRDPHVGEVINACDAGREGELIFRYVYEHAGCTHPVRRFWVSSLTTQAIRAGLGALRPGADYDALGAAARCRAEADWLVGMNGTRGLTARADGLLSVGRVQTPTLAMVVEREAAIEAFVPTAYWEVFAELAAEKGTWTARWTGSASGPDEKPPPEDAPRAADGKKPEDTRGRLPSAEAVAALVAKLDGETARVTVAERDRQTVRPPQLHHLTSLQREANRRFRFTAARTLRAAQTLYEREKLITYPRTDSRHLTRDVAAGLPAVVSAIGVGPWGAYAQRLLAGPAPRLGRRVVDDAQVGDHHAIIPTAVRPDLDGLGADERRIYELIARRLLAALSPDAIYARTRLVAEAAGERLEARGRVCLEPGWEEVDPPARARKRGAGEAPPALPAVEVGDAADVRGARAEAKQTRPPPRYTEASLLGAMERAGRDLDDAALRAAMRDSGLGTPATRAATVETLVRRSYLDREGRTMVPTAAGRALVGALPVDTLKSPRMTAEWERRLTAIAEGRADPSKFRRDIREFVADLVAALAAAPRVTVPVEAGGRRGRRGARSGGRSGGRSGARRSGGRRSGGRSGGRRSESRRSESRRSESRRGARSTPRGRSMASRDKAGSQPRALPEPHRPLPPPAPPREPGPPRCPACGQGRIITGNRGWGCDRWRAGCRFVVWFEQDGVRVPEAEAERLFRFGRTRPFARLPGAAAPVGLVLDRDAEGNVRWERLGG